MKLLYVGTTPITFITGGVGMVTPGEEFNVPDELASAFLGRSDVVETTATVEERSSTKRRRGGKEPGQSAAADGGDPKKMSEENSGVPDDH